MQIFKATIVLKLDSYFCLSVNKSQKDISLSYQASVMSRTFLFMD